MVTRDEEHSTRGRANLLRLTLSRRPAARGADRRPPARGARPLRRVQGLQGRVPLRRRHGQAQVRDPGAAQPGARRPAAVAPLREHRGAQPPRQPCGRGSRTRSPALGRGAHCCNASAASTATGRCRGFAARDLPRLVQHNAQACRLQRRRAATWSSSTTPSPTTTTPRSAGPPCASWRRWAIASCWPKAPAAAAGRRSRRAC